MPDLLSLRDLALRTARSVAPELARRAGGSLDTNTKSSTTDLVTDADLWSENRIAELLHDARPDDAIQCEEGTTVTGTSGVRWVVDPIDGTTNFVYGHPGFSVSIGAELDGEPAVGVILDPILGDEFAAALGHGATRNGTSITVSNTTVLSEALLATGFGYQPDRRRRQAEGLVEILPRVRDIRRMGGAALDLASVACGRVDAFFERGLAPWDIAAGIVIVREAGGRVCDLSEGSPTGDLVVAAPEGILSELLSLLRSSGADRT
ncbi:MAG: inositol monophosphatase family protein [Acidimicrobiales bacterium]|jgi:myo-inositol-1(or 4)-monophosphatase|nr:inositol monophosphatase family protein [Acidimicrobiales bacterium]|tara:strand:+ start:22067 stop:22858 length:792 start_codon:yes stop_codon:yes gene_type:complete